MVTYNIETRFSLRRLRILALVHQTYLLLEFVLSLLSISNKYTFRASFCLVTIL